MISFLQIDNAVIAQKGHTAAKLNDLMSLYMAAKTEKQYNAVKARVIAFRFGTYSTNTIREAFELFPIKDSAVFQMIKEDFMRWLKQAERELS